MLLLVRFVAAGFVPPMPRIVLPWMANTLADWICLWQVLVAMLPSSGPVDRSNFAAANSDTLSKRKGCFGHAWGLELANICVAVFIWALVGSSSFLTVL